MSSDEYGDDAQPTFNNLDGTRSNDTRKRRPPNYDGNVNVLPTGEKEEEHKIEQLLPKCRICNSKRVDYDRILESIVCSMCGDIREATLESLIAEQRQLSSQTDPYTPVKPVFTSVNPSSLSNYEDIHTTDNERYRGSPQDALREEWDRYRRRHNSNRSWLDK